MVIESNTDIKVAMEFNGWLNRNTIDEITIKIPMDSTEREQLQKKLLRLFNDCGCTWGTVAFFISFILYLLSYAYLIDFSFSLIGKSFLVGIVCAVIAKLVALLVSYIQLKNELCALEKRIRMISILNNK